MGGTGHLQHQSSPPDAPTGLDVAEHLQPGDTVVIGQAVAEPATLVAQLVRAARSVDRVTALCGYSVTPAWADATPGHPRIKASVAAGPLRKLQPGVLDYLPLHASRYQDHIASGRLPVDMVLLQVGPLDADGYYNLGGTVDHAIVAAERARTVLVEVNTNMPRTRCSRRLHHALVTAALHTDVPLARSPARPSTDAERAVAANVATLVPDGAVIQLGLGSLAEAVGAALCARRRLRVRSGLIGDWLVELSAAGALATGPAAVVATMALGGPELYAFLDGAADVEFASNADVVRALAGEALAPFVAINSAVEVDLLGQVGAEIAGRRVVGGVGGQVDFLRAAHHNADGTAVVALPAGAPPGTSRIVPRLEDSPVTSLKSDVDVVVTDWGVADIRACSVSERAERLIAVAHPDHRASLAAQRPAWT